MWKPGCCVSVILIVAIVGVCINVLIVQTGDTPNEYPELLHATATVHYEYNEIWINVVSDLYKHGNKTKTISYDEAYDDQCEDTGDTGTSYCKSLKNLKISGIAYMVLCVAGCAFCFAAIVLCILDWFGKLTVDRRFPAIRYMVAALIALAVLAFLIAWAVFWGVYTDNLDNVIDGLIDTYYPLLKAFEWDDAYIGPSIDLLIACNALGLGALVVAVMLERPKTLYPFGYTQQPDYHTTA